jgi:DNA-binding NarL/FixJ family response regulator
MNGCNEILGQENETLASVSEVSARKSGSERVWLVDDNENFRSLLANLLDREGFECEREFANPDEALAALAREIAPDIILLDIQMGKYNGLDAVRPFKCAARDTHVLMLTTFSPPEARARAFREGASDFLLKSWEIEEIARHMRQAMEFGSMAGLLTAFLYGGISVVEKPAAPKPTVAAPALTIAERWMAYLRGFMKLSPSSTAESI